jgi:hypothetical protein
VPIASAETAFNRQHDLFLIPFFTINEISSIQKESLYRQAEASIGLAPVAIFTGSCS